jgi:predicted protein tyrosine phosphatase
LKSQRTKILFICSRNKRRSLTAETIFKNGPGWEIRSAGTEESARIKVTAGHLGWADVISDEYEFMDSNLIELLREKMREHFPAAE